jgi:hypothetical protein
MTLIAQRRDERAEPAVGRLQIREHSALPRYRGGYCTRNRRATESLKFEEPTSDGESLTGQKGTWVGLSALLSRPNKFKLKRLLSPCSRHDCYRVCYRLRAGALGTRRLLRHCDNNPLWRFH